MFITETAWIILLRMAKITSFNLTAFPFISPSKKGGFDSRNTTWKLGQRYSTANPTKITHETWDHVVFNANPTTLRWLGLIEGGEIPGVEWLQLERLGSNFYFKKTMRFGNKYSQRLKEVRERIVLRINWNLILIISENFAIPVLGIIGFLLLWDFCHLLT